MTTQCEAITLVSTYSNAHQCLKTSGIRKHGKRNLCAHHRSSSQTAERTQGRR
jgi:hypothetical protein